MASGTTGCCRSMAGKWCLATPTAHAARTECRSLCGEANVEARTLQQTLGRPAPQQETRPLATSAAASARHHLYLLSLAPKPEVEGAMSLSIIRVTCCHAVSLSPLLLQALQRSSCLVQFRPGCSCKLFIGHWRVWLSVDEPAQVEAGATYQDWRSAPLRCHRTHWQTVHLASGCCRQHNTGGHLPARLRRSLCGLHGRRRQLKSRL